MCLKRREALSLGSFAERVRSCLNLPAAACRAWGRGAQPPRISFASFSLCRAKKMKSRKRNLALNFLHDYTFRPHRSSKISLNKRLTLWYSYIIILSELNK